MSGLSGFISIEEAKDQVYVEHDRTDLDDRITRLLTSAEEWAVQFMNIDSLADLEESPAVSPPAIPELVKSGILLRFEFEFDRDVDNADLLMKRAEETLWPYRIGLGV